MKTLTRPGTPDESLTHDDVTRLFEDGYREIEVLPDGRIRETSQNGRPARRGGHADAENRAHLVLNLARRLEGLSGPT